VSGLSSLTAASSSAASIVNRGLPEVWQTLYPWRLLNRRGWERVSGLWVLVWVRLRWRLRSPLLPIGSACGGHGGDYREVEKEFFYGCGYGAVSTILFVIWFFVDTGTRGLENQSLVFFGCRGIGSP